ncbi:MAG: DUF5828 family protein [Candidatus Nanohaloarchaea archaeon]
MEREDFALVEEGSWDEIVDFCRDLSRALDSTLPDEGSGFQEWRPKEEDSREDMNDRTAEDESLRETHLEEESEGTEKELSTAVEEARDSGSELARGNPGKSARKAGEAGGSTVQGLIPVLLRLVRGLERTIYRHVISPTNPNYFESESFSVSIERRLLKGIYRCKINFEDRETLSEVEERMEE